MWEWISSEFSGELECGLEFVTVSFLIGFISNTRGFLGLMLIAQMLEITSLFMCLDVNFATLVIAGLNKFEFLDKCVICALQCSHLHRLNTPTPKFL